MTHTASTDVRPAGRGLASRTWIVDDPGADALALLGPGGFAWFADGLALATAGVAARVAAAEVADVLAAIAGDDPVDVPGSGPIAVGALGFDGRRELVIPARIGGRAADGRAWITEVGPADDGAEGWPAEPLRAAPDTLDRRRWRAAVEEALARIADGRLDKVVLARQVTVDLGRTLDVPTIVDRLRREQPSSFTAAVGSYVGASPELLVRRRGRHVLSRPLAGTAAQGGDAGEDSRLVAAMAASVKEQFEHRLVVRDVCAALADLCDDVVAAERPDVVRLSTVAHLATTVSARLRDPAVSALAVATRLHPTPAVAGVPCAAALAAIAELEGFDRGLYAGPVGWVDARGDGDWALALRGATLDGSRARLVAGAGIVAGSDPDAEWAETEAKLGAMRAALAAG
ncbi:MAG TPA: isochorismate synthase [Acidimicrobiales bacterium]|nr:isochorismate synthase [Acidimicrobiales bacterium]